MSYTDLRDFYPEATFNVPQLNRDDVPLVIEMEKSGGGGVGRAYDGTWRYVVNYDGQDRVYFGQELETNRPHTHEEAAREVARWLSDYGDADSGYDGDSRPTGTALKMCKREYDRLAMWANGDVE